MLLFLLSFIELGSVLLVEAHHLILSLFGFMSNILGLIH